MVHAWRFPGEHFLTGRSGLPAAEVEAMREEWSASAHRALWETLSGDKLGAAVHVLQGEPRDVIPAHAAEHDVDLIVGGTQARSGVSGFLIGNTAEDLIRRSRCAILAVKPPGFVTPVDLS